VPLDEVYPKKVGIYVVSTVLLPFGNSGRVIQERGGCVYEGEDVYALAKNVSFPLTAFYCRRLSL